MEYHSHIEQDGVMTSHEVQDFLLQVSHHQMVDAVERSPLKCRGDAHHASRAWDLQESLKMKLSKPICDSPHFKSFQICQQFANAWVMAAWVSTMCMMRTMRMMCTRPLPLNRNLQLSSFTTTSEGVFTEEVQSSCKAIHSGETLKLHQHGRSL